MTRSLFIFGLLGLASTAFAFYRNKHLFTEGGAGRVSLLEGIYYFVGVAGICLGWYFNVRYVHAYPHNSNYVNYTKMLFTNWAADSAAQDYTIVNVVLLPLWTIVDGRRRQIRSPWIFFVMSLFTSLAFAMAFYLAFVERQVRYDRERSAVSSTA
jgi:drug/metabolite transporter (DMT)-like permease